MQQIDWIGDGTADIRTWGAMGLRLTVIRPHPDHPPSRWSADPTSIQPLDESPDADGRAWLIGEALYGSDPLGIEPLLAQFR
ncbi:MAG: hypothetical protein ACK5N0_12360 [Synechococcaceae cyanobacterium]